MKEHRLKIQERFLKEIVSGEKTFEIRKNDRGFQKGDVVKLYKLYKHNYEMKANTHDKDSYDYKYTVSNVFTEVGFGLEPGYCILSFKKV